MRKTNKRKEGLLERIVRWLFNKELLKNKMYAITMMLIGLITIPVGDGDCTAFVLTLIIGLPLFFAKENVIN